MIFNKDGEWLLKLMRELVVNCKANSGSKPPRDGDYYSDIATYGMTTNDYHREKEEML